jgi:peptidoglycan/LPS O-acetylase OafA/YrhL
MALSVDSTNAGISVVSPTAPSVPRVEALTGLRWFAALWVFGYHMMVFGPLPFPFDQPNRLGFLGVTFFFILSGFVLTWSMRSSLRVSTFYTRRFARIWPAHMVALLLAIPIFYSLTPDPAQSWVKALSLPILLLSVFLLQGFSRDPEILFSGNPAAWTLSCEAFFYALHPFLGRILRRLSKNGALALTVGTVIFAFAYRLANVMNPGVWWSVGTPLPLVHLPEFILGMAIAWAFLRGWRPRFPVSAGWVIACAIIGWCTVAPGLGLGTLSELSGVFSNELATVAFALLIIGVVSHTLRGGRSWLEHPIMVWLGNVSYAFYLVHATVMYAVMNLIGGARGSGFSNLVWGAGIFVIALVLSAVIHHWIEAPTERRIRSWKDRRDAKLLPTNSTSTA